MNQDGIDLNTLLDEWKYDETDNVRRVNTPEGREVIQVRLPLGVEQYEIHGRPDGERPGDKESWYHFYSDLAEKEPWNFALDPDDFEKLKNECLLYYYRYLLFFQIREYSFCARDTQRNLNVLDFVGQHVESETSASLEQYRPYILRMHLMARALEMVEDGDEEAIRQACALLESGMHDVVELDPIEGNKVFAHEQRTSLRVLENLREQLAEMLPPDPESELKHRLEEAIEQEDYEEAARLRDRLANDSGLEA